MNTPTPLDGGIKRHYLSTVCSTKINSFSKVPSDEFFLHLLINAPFILPFFSCKKIVL